MDKLQVGEVYTEEGSREVRAILRWTENTVDFKIIRLLQREVPQNLITYVRKGALKGCVAVMATLRGWVF